MDLDFRHSSRPSSGCDFQVGFSSGIQRYMASLLTIAMVAGILIVSVLVEPLDLHCGSCKDLLQRKEWYGFIGLFCLLIGLNACRRALSEDERPDYIDTVNFLEMKCVE